MKTKQEIEERCKFLVSCLRNDSIFSKTEIKQIKEKITEYNWILELDAGDLATGELKCH